MHPQHGLVEGLEILNPFLKQHNFGLDNYESLKGSSGEFTLAKYKNDRKTFVLGYRFSIGQVAYQFEESAVSHDFYLNKLGFRDKKLFNEVQTEDKLLAFSHILHDFKYLVDDFFKGECVLLKQYSKLQENIIIEYDKKARDGYNIEFDKLRIEKARYEFKSKNFKTSLEIYKSIDCKELMNALDEQLIEFCLRHI